MKNKILIEENLDLFNQIIGDFKSFKPLLNDLRSNYEALELGEFNHEIFTELKSKGVVFVSDKFRNKLNKELDKVGVESLFIRKNMIVQHETLIEKLTESLVKLKKFKPVTYSIDRPLLTINEISISDDFYVSDRNKESILNKHCRVYIENEDEHKAFAVVQELKKSFNEYLEIFDKTGMVYVNKLLASSLVLKLNEVGKLDINAKAVKNLANYAKERELMKI